ncbi:hypothetical protein GGS20DRAFT_584256 [Poronia punctata]|nr:hypothetical protein GGS20DRAFT_584256 [Poronia punctata]
MSLSRARARYRADIVRLGKDGIPNTHDIRTGEVEDEVIFTFSHPELRDGQMEIHVMPQDVAGYPNNIDYIAYVVEDIPQRLIAILENVVTSMSGIPISDMVKSLVQQLCAVLDASPVDVSDSLGSDIQTKTAGSDNNEDDDDEEDGDDEDDDEDNEYDFGYGDDDTFGLNSSEGSPAPWKLPSPASVERIRQDLRMCRNAGFRVGKIQGIDDGSFYSILSLSVKTSQLMLSPETRIAWNLGDAKYIVLLMRYGGEYQPLERVLDSSGSLSLLEFRLRLCNKYRPTAAQANAEFLPNPPGHIDDQANDEIQARGVSGVKDGELSSFGIERAIELLLNKDFVTLMKMRAANTVSWAGAKKIHSAVARSGLLSVEVPAGEVPSVEAGKAGLPPILIKDHLLERNPSSLPLIAAQFAFYHLIKCADYCTICHEKVPGNLESLKPYVCSKPLCLFQYMNLGLGPSIEREVMDRELVVDLLVSFCWASLQPWKKETANLRNFPEGINLQVPNIRSPSYQAGSDDNITPGHCVLLNPLQVKISWKDRRATLVDKVKHGQFAQLNVGQWVVLRTGSGACATADVSVRDVFHYALIKEKYYEIIWLHVAARHFIPACTATDALKQYDWDGTSAMAGQLVVFDQCLEDLDSVEKAFSMTLLLATLPPLAEMKAYLEQSNGPLTSWARMVPSALKLMKWIIVSNRSVIVQVEQGSEERLPGFPGWAQFRIAQGSPEKEALFQQALEQLDKPRPTILAWHGSPLVNWHSIIREGLDFQVKRHGRSYGDGVYFTFNFDYALQYSLGLAAASDEAQAALVWPQSSLRISKTICLCELVNRPDDYVNSCNPYVIDVLHWFQCRYLFVCTEREANNQMIPTANVEEFVQDPLYPLHGCNSKEVFVPKAAFPSASDRRRHRTSFSAATSVQDGEDTDEEDEEDAMFLRDPSAEATTTAAMVDETKTDFRPGMLNFTTLPVMAFPSYATPAAQKTIQKELAKLQKVQSVEPLHTLGWYIDFDRITNMFQWIVELHSFDPDLPLAMDMKVAGITSIVLEIRFLSGFPMTPPFVRVIKPRFLPFALGGGGHVTSGGAMCMELLTNTGWSPAASMESVLLQVRLALTNPEPRPARLDQSTGVPDHHYGIREAVEAYTRVATAHGWAVPPEFAATMAEFGS